MHFLVLLYGDEAAGAEPGTPEFDAEMAGYIAFGELAADAIRGGAALESIAGARTVRHDGGEVTVSDGPFAEATEVLGGFYVLEADDLDQVIDLVRHLPATATGASEIRPLPYFDDFKGLGDDEIGRTTMVTLHGAQADGPAHQAFYDANAEHVAQGGALGAESSATTVRVRDGEVLVSDGPFSEAQEVAGGYYLLDGDADTVADVAARIPMGPGGIVAIRKVMDLGEVM